LIGDWFLLRGADLAQAVQHFRKWYVETGTPWLSNRVAMWKPRVSVDPRRISVGDLGFRWGSCGRNGVVYFNWRLLQLPVRLIDYVVVHELTHLVEHNHTREFWRMLDRVLPDWRERKTGMECDWQSFAVFGIHGKSTQVR
jgi:predicted metal-dependent hydrolase